MFSGIQRGVGCLILHTSYSFFFPFLSLIPIFSLFSIFPYFSCFSHNCPLVGLLLCHVLFCLSVMNPQDLTLTKRVVLVPYLCYYNVFLYQHFLPNLYRLYGRSVCLQLQCYKKTAYEQSSPSRPLSNRLHKLYDLPSPITYLLVLLFRCQFSLVPSLFMPKYCQVLSTHTHTMDNCTVV